MSARGSTDPGTPAGQGSAGSLHLGPAAVEDLRTALLAAPGVEALAPEGRKRLVAGVVGSCEAYLAERAVQAGTRSGEIATRLALAETRARELADAIEALDGIGWGLFGRALAATAGDDPPTEPGAAPDAVQALRSLRRVSAATNAG